LDDFLSSDLGVIVGVPADFELLHRSVVRSLRAENAAPRTIEAYTLAVERLGEHLADTTASLPTTNDPRREHVEDFLDALSEQGPGRRDDQPAVTVAEPLRRLPGRGRGD
jgi:hypothetical protein